MVKRWLGTILLEQRTISPEQLAIALAHQRRTRSLIGRILIGMGALRPRELAEAHARQAGLPFADLIAVPPEMDIIDGSQRHLYRRWRYLPWQRDEAHQIIIAVTQLTPKLEQWLKERYGQQCRFAVTSPRDLQLAMERVFGELDAADAVQELLIAQPRHSARHVLSHAQRIWLFSMLTLVGCLLYTAPEQALYGLAFFGQIAFLIAILFKGWIFWVGYRQPPPCPVPLLFEHQLPTYTVLVPLYRETEAVSHLLDAIRALDYPKCKLDVKLIVEEDDTDTQEILKRLAPEGYFHLIRVPYSLPRTKPKACNYALRFAEGELITIYDAEDRPEPLQLRKTASQFAREDRRTLCLQARLNYYNRDENLLTKLFSIEYAAWFHIMLRGLEAKRIPIPLGGTSNHLHRQNLQKLYAWDAYNVTEDADLGIRMAAVGGRTGLVDSDTLEEAPTRISVWLRQRSRWIKGYMQTWLVHMRHPQRLRRTLGWRGFLGFQLFIGGPVIIFLLTPFLWTAVLAMGITGLNSLPSYASIILYGLSITNLSLALTVHFLQALFVLYRLGWEGMLGALLLFPVYWLLHSLASIKALWQLLTRPHHWEKTPHGLSKFVKKSVN